MKPTIGFDFLSICFLIHICYSQAAPLQWRSASNRTAVLTLPSSPRKVHVITDLDRNKRAISLKTGRWVLGGHSSIWIDGTATDGPLLLGIGANPFMETLVRGQRWVIQAEDLGNYNTGKRIPTHGFLEEIRHVAELGTTSFTNAEIFDPTTGTGWLANAWYEDPVYVVGTGSRPNDCYDFVIRVLARMNLRIDSLTQRMFDNSEEFYTRYSKRWVQRIEDVASDTFKPVDEHRDEVHTKVFNVDFVQNPDAPSLIFEEDRYHYHRAFVEPASSSKAQ